MKKKRTRKTVSPLAQEQWWNKLYSTLSCINLQREMEFDGVEVSFDDACPSFGEQITAGMTSTVTSLNVMTCMTVAMPTTGMIESSAYRLTACLHQA